MKINLNLDELREKEFNLRFGRIAGEDVVLVYPEGFPKFEKHTLIFRSSVWTLDGTLVSAGFKKFVNLGEAPDLIRDPTDKDLNTAKIMEKLDGCCDENTILTTEDGEKTIRWICENKYKGKILAFDVESGEEVWVTIIAFSILDDNGDWYDLETVDGTKVRLTGIHRVWLPELNCYRMVKDLKGDEEVLLKN